MLEFMPLRIADRRVSNLDRRDKLNSIFEFQFAQPFKQTISSFTRAFLRFDSKLIFFCLALS